MGKRDTSITAPIDEPTAGNYLATRRSELERKAVDMAPLALTTLGKVMESEQSSPSAKVSAARVVLEQAVGRPNVRPEAAIQAGTVINVSIRSFSVNVAGSTLPIPIEMRAVETDALEGEE